MFLIVKLSHGGEGRNLHRTNIFAGERLGAACGKMRFVFLPDVLLMVCAAGCDKISIIGEFRAVELVALGIVRADLKT